MVGKKPSNAVSDVEIEVEIEWTPSNSVLILGWVAVWLLACAVALLAITTF